jgi:hypothetical protein
MKPAFRLRLAFVGELPIQNPSNTPVNNTVRVVNVSCLPNISPSMMFAAVTAASQGRSAHFPVSRSLCAVRCGEPCSVRSQSAVSPQQFRANFHQPNGPKALTSAFMAVSTQLTDTNARNVIRALLRRLGRQRKLTCLIAAIKSATSTARPQ